RPPSPQASTPPGPAPAPGGPWPHGLPPTPPHRGEGTSGTSGAAVRLAARVQESRGEVLERLARPRAALDAYRSALELWTRPGAAGEGEADAADAEGRTEALRARVRALEAGL
ncbi:hypothetical protein AB0B44_43920, partial [Streptomyces sp. NPDC041003]